MKVEIVGEGEPEHAVMVGIHGDEPCGKKAWERFKQENWRLKKPVKFVLANPEAMEQGERFLETDLNRVYPSSLESDVHEEKRAAELIEELKGLKIIDIHSTKSTPVPFGVLDNPSEKAIELTKSTGVENFVDFKNMESKGIISGLKAVCVECGPQGTEEAVDMAYNMLINFLAAEDVIEANYKKSSPRIYRVQEKVDGSGYEFTAENFKKVEEGEVFARKQDDELIAQEGFYPVLMSTDGYEDIVGFKADKVEKAKQL
jgi:succinylglutamate desuccinylase